MAKRKAAKRSKLPDLDDRLSLKELSPHCPPRGVHFMTLVRWSREGLLVNGERLKLRTEKIGGRVYSCRRWLNELIAAQQQSQQGRDHFVAPSAKADFDRELAG